MTSRDAQVPPRIAVLTVSDGVSAGTREDAGGAAITAWARLHEWPVVAHDVIPDTVERIVNAMIEHADSGNVDVIITTGGTGMTVRDVTPESTRAVIERDAPGIAEAIRAAGSTNSPYAALSRGIAGIRGATLVVNLPGSVGGVHDGLHVLEPLLEHAAQLLRGVDTESHELPHA